MSEYTLTFALASEGTFGTGRGLGTHDATTSVDPETGLPRIPATTLLGLWASAAAQLLRSLRRAAPALADDLTQAAPTVFGEPGGRASRLLTDEFATVPEGDLLYVRTLRAQMNVSAAEVRAAATAIHVQTSVDHGTGVGVEGSRRQSERVLRHTPFHLGLSAPDLSADHPAAQLLGASAALVRRGGTGRRRGLGRFSTWELCDSSGDDQLRLARDAFYHRLTAA